MWVLQQEVLLNINSSSRQQWKHFLNRQDVPRKADRAALVEMEELASSDPHGASQRLYGTPGPEVGEGERPFPARAQRLVHCW